MNISDVLNVKNIKLNMLAKTKEEAVEELADLLVQDGAVVDKAQFMRDVWLREEQAQRGSKITLRYRMVNLRASPIRPWPLAVPSMKLPGKRWTVAMSAALSYLPFAWWIKTPPISAYCHKFQDR